MIREERVSIALTLTWATACVMMVGGWAIVEGCRTLVKDTTERVHKLVDKE